MLIRLIIFAFVLGCLVIGVVAIWGVLRWIGGPARAPSEDTLPETIRTIAFIVLIILMFGVTSGVMGA